MGLKVLKKYCGLHEIFLYQEICNIDFEEDLEKFKSLITKQDVLSKLGRSKTPALPKTLEMALTQ